MGYTIISCDAYNESGDLKKQVIQYRQTHGFYPEAVVADQIYGTGENKKYLRVPGIKYSGRPLGRRPKETEENREELRENDEQLKKYQKMRSGTEGKSGQSRNFYGLNQTAARLEKTGISRIMAVFTGVNLIRVLKELKLFIFWLIRKYPGNEQMVASAVI
ncbi:MAG: transposase [Ignavibacteria bacterium]